MDQVTNPMKASAMEYLVNTGRDVAAAHWTPTAITIGTDTFADLNQRGKFELVRPADPVRPDMIEIFSLQGLVDFIKADVDGIFGDEKRRHIVRVINPENVAIETPITGTANARITIAGVRAKVAAIKFNEYQACEDATIMLLTRFVETENRAQVLALIGNIVADQSITTQDDGFSQRLTIKNGVAGIGYAAFQNPAYLVARRTFAEVDQPEAPFVIRFKNEGGKDGDKSGGKNTVAIFEADGGEWKIDAVKNIKAWLMEQLAGTNVEIIA